MEVSLQWKPASSPWHEVEADPLVIPFLESEQQDPCVASGIGQDSELAKLLRELAERDEFRGKRGQSLLLYRPSGVRARRVLVLGLGKIAELNRGRWRTAVMNGLRSLDKTAGPVAFCLGSLLDGRAHVEAAVDGVLMAEYRAHAYKSDAQGRMRIADVVFPNSRLDQELLRECVEEAVILGEAVNLARHLTNEPGNRLSPRLFAGVAEEVAGSSNLGLEVFDEKKIASLGMHAVLAVAQGSGEPPRFLVLRHEGGPEDSPPVVLVGKGVTFDSGGLSLKTSKSMEEMKTDKAGGCAVLGAMQGISKLDVPKNVVGLIPLVENLPGGRAQRPGDVIATLSGKTVEVLNTDAEGRLILADALTYARQMMDPSLMVDIATLTGAAVVALGKVRAAYFSNDEAAASALERAAEEAGELLWRMPLDPEYREELESTIADIKNVGGRWAGAVTAAKFLQEFVGDSPWCHIDMAGMDLFASSSEGEGPRGFGVRTLIEVARNF